MNERIKAVVQDACAVAFEYSTFGTRPDLVDGLSRLSKSVDLLEPQDLAECGAEVGE